MDSEPARDVAGPLSSICSTVKKKKKKDFFKIILIKLPDQ